MFQFSSIYSSLWKAAILLEFVTEDQMENTTHSKAKMQDASANAIAQCSGKPLFFPVPVLTNFWPPRIFFVKTQRIRNKPSNFTNFLLYNQIILHKRGNQKVQKNIILSMFEQKLFNFPC